MFRILVCFFSFYSFALSDVGGVILKFNNENNILFKLNSKKKLLCTLAYVKFPKSSLANDDLNSCKEIKIGNIKILYKKSYKTAYNFFKKYKGFRIEPILIKNSKKYMCVIKVYNTNFNYELVRKGYAFANFTQITNPNLKEKYKKALQEAKKNKLGLWKKHEKDMLCLSGENVETNESTLRPNWWNFNS